MKYITLPRAITLIAFLALNGRAYADGFSADIPSHNGCSLKPATECAGADLKGADLSGLDLTGANFAGANLEGADLRHSNLKGQFRKSQSSQREYEPGAPNEH